ncbi:BTAD domain-containing putative transcriptional regulator [Fodinicola feengrottensis]|uniref:BTAD domain-containing putative transcriptional regulator n=1 Tax=Fodinicola feengrottensis TaxID=435914 RepID=A0ABN2G639_9ACTN
MLGELSAETDSGAVALGAVKQRVTLAVLVEKRGTVVPVAQLIDAVWGRRPPKTAAKNLQIYVYHLRQLLDDPARISRQATGYQLDIEPGELDADRFQRLTGAALAEADPTAAGALWRRALGQWRGPAYDGLHHVPLLAEAAERLAERRLTALEGRIEAELGSDQSLPDRLVAELTDLVGRWPWRERFVGQLMRALHRTGRPAQALDAYERGRRALADELGLDPGPELREVEREIRATSAPGGPAPAQLPADIADFAGREKEVDAAVDVLGKTADALSVVAISGPAGVGKTTLAVRIGHRIRGACPDGQLYVDLAGANGRPADPAAVLAAFLRALRLPAAAIPDRLAERIACYRSMLADRRILIVLDNAADHAHIEPLLPGTPSCPVVVTSRVRLTGLPGGHLIDLRPLELSDSLTLIGRMVGPDRIGVEVAAARELARLCGGLPLALRVAGAKLAARTHWTVRDLVDRLADEHHRLDELRHRELQVRASFGLSFQGLSEPAGRLFGRLGQLDAPDLAGWVAAAVLDCPIADAEALLVELVDTRLLEVAGRDALGQHRYRFHDLLRVYARERGRAAEPAAVRTAALRRAFAGWLALMDRAHGAVFGDGATNSEATGRWQPIDGWPELLLDASLAWPDAERGNLMAAVRQTADEPALRDLCWELAALSIEEFAAFDDVEDWRDTGTYALTAMRESGHRSGQAALELQLGALHATRRRYADATDAISRAHNLFTDAGDSYGIGLTLRLRGILRLADGDLDGAEESLLAARELLKGTSTEAHVLIYLGRIASYRAQTQDALCHFGAAAERARATHASKLWYEAIFWTGETQLSCGSPEAAGTLHSAADHLLATGTQVADGYGLFARADGYLAADRLADAKVTFVRCGSVARRNGDRVIQARVLQRLSQLALRLGDAPEAVRLIAESLTVSDQAFPPLDRAALLDAAVDAYAAAGDLLTAGAYRQARTDLLTGLGLPPSHGRPARPRSSG